MKKLLVVALCIGTLAGCRESTRPVETEVLVGTYHLTAVDGNALPHSITIDNEPVTVASGELELTAARTLALSLMLGTPGSPTFQSIALAGTYRRVTADSVVFPVLAPEFFIKRTGPTVVLVSQSSGGAIGPATLIGGSHRFTFIVEAVSASQ